jgi:hypothetical protein
VAELVHELSARQQQAVRLLEHSRRLQRELSSLCAVNLSIRARARELVAHARLATAQGHHIGFFRTANVLARPSAAPPA